MGEPVNDWAIIIAGSLLIGAAAYLVLILRAQHKRDRRDGA